MNKKLGILFRISGLPGSGKTQVAKLTSDHSRGSWGFAPKMVDVGQKWEISRKQVPHMTKVVEVLQSSINMVLNKTLKQRNQKQIVYPQRT